MEFSSNFILDGTPKEQDEIVEKFLSSFTNDEIERSMSDEFSYLDED
ncbi:MAG: hypothetical protein LIO62_04605 [Clostridiales bacterium]|nr:hypothetical protein [Clostridiales bacterium]